MDILLGLFAFALFLLYLWKARWVKNIGLNFKALAGLFSLNILCGIALTFIYTYYYPDRNLADTFKYFDDSAYLFQVFQSDPSTFWKLFLGIQELGEETVRELSFTYNWFPESRRTFYNDNRTIIRINTLLRFVSFGSYAFHLVFFIALAFVGKLLIFKTGKYYLKASQLLFWIIAVFFLPSILFWTSGVLKEGPLFLLLGAIVYLLHRCHLKGWDFKLILLLSGCAFAMVFIKFYTIIFMLPAFFFALQIRYFKISKVKLLLYNFLGYIFLIQLWHWIHPRWSLLTILQAKKNDFEGLAMVENANSYIATFPLKANIWSFIANIPQGLFNSFFQPLLWKANSFFVALAALENIAVLFLIGFLYYYRKKVHFHTTAIFCLVYAFVFLAIIGMITPIAGSLVRYKIPVLPFLLFPFIQNLDFNKLSLHNKLKIEKLSQLFT